MTAASKKQFLGALLLAASAGQASAFRPSPSMSHRSSTSLCSSPDQTSEIHGHNDNDVGSSISSSMNEGLPLSRRALFRDAASATIAGMTVAAAPSLFPVGFVANAASNVPTPAELERLRKGHARVKYMLQNWEDITEICRNNSDQANKQVVRTDGGDKCEKTPLNVQIYMGYKSTEDPLYKADKLMVRAAALVKDDFDQADYLEAVENYKEKADNTAMMAYTSSWGEANPNGGKDVIDDYLEKTRLDVVSSEKSLLKILAYLGLEPLPASKNP